MKRKNVGAGAGFCFFFIVIAVVVTIFYMHRDDLGGYSFTHTRLIHDRGIAEYDSSSIVAFPIKGDYSETIGKDVYYYDKSGELKKDSLISVSLPDGQFVVSDGAHSMDKFLGVPDGGCTIFGSLLDFLTSEAVFIFLILIPGILCVLYEIYVFIMSFRQEKQ